MIPRARQRMLAGSSMSPAESKHDRDYPTTEPPEYGPMGAAEEEAYRRHYLRSDTLPAATLIGLIGFASAIIFFKNDRQLFGPGPELYRLLVVRLIELSVAFGAVGVLVRSKSPRVHDRAIVVALVTLVLANFYIVSTRPPEFIGHGSITAFAITLFYFALPGPLVARTAVGLAMSASTFVFALRAPVPVIGLNTMLLTHALTHLVGVPMAMRLEGLRRRRFAAETKARYALAELAKKARDLEIAKERAERLARAKSDFLATMSHEFRTPMNAVIGLSELLGDSPLAPDQRDLVSTIRDSAGALLFLLNDILDLAKIDAGRMSLESAPFDVRALAERALDVVRHQATAKGLTAEVIVDESVPSGVLGDAGRLRQALVNLLSNSVKFTEKGTIGLRISSLKCSDDGPEHDLRFRVEDSGIGISAETLERLFAPFEQGDASATRHHGGTGLGLSITKRIVELMGGSVSVESRVGHGSAFEFVLRARAAAGSPTSCRFESSSSKTTWSISGWPWRRWAAWVTSPTWPTTGLTRSASWSAATTTWSSWICRCPAWMDSRPRGARSPRTPGERARASWR
jgi:signal transduction histidine kinase